MPSQKRRPRTEEERAKIAAGQRAQWQKRHRDAQGRELLKWAETFVEEAAERGDRSAQRLLERIRELD